MTFKCAASRLWWLNTVYWVKGDGWKKRGIKTTETTTPVSRLLARFSYAESRMMPSRLPRESKILAQGTQQGNTFGISSSFSWRKKNAFLLIIGYLRHISLPRISLPRKWSIKAAQCYKESHSQNVISVPFRVFQMSPNKAL